MAFTLPNLPYSYDALEPVISKETLQTHHDKHHKGYVDKLNELIAGTNLEHLELEEIILEAAGGDGEKRKIFNNAGQAWNHTFFWNCLTTSSGPMSPFLQKLIDKNFGNVDKFMSHFTQTCVELFGSGWVWLVKNKNDSLSVVPMPNAGNPIIREQTPLLVCDVWEHAYYLDYKNERESFVKSVWDVVNWEFVELNFQKSSNLQPTWTRPSDNKQESRHH